MSNIVIINDERFVECPICKSPYKSLVRHVPCVHGIPNKQFHEDYPEIIMQVGEKSPDSVASRSTKYDEYYGQFKKGDFYECPDCGKLLERLTGLQVHCLSHGRRLLTKKELGAGKIEDKNYTCSICGGVYSSKRGLQIHMSTIHKSEYSEEKRVEEEKKEGFVCPICGKKYVGLRDHIVFSHSMDWETFKKDFNWVKGGSYISESHRKSLSVNKKKFYNETPEGVALRGEQSKNWDSTYCSPNNRRSYVFFHTAFKGSLCRSFQEYYIKYVLEKNNIDYTYEDLKIAYVKDGCLHHYTPDIIIGNNLYEIKSSEKEFDTEKYHLILSSLEKTSLKLHLLTLKNYCEVLDVSPVTEDEVIDNLRSQFWTKKDFQVGGALLYYDKLGKEAPFLKKVFGDTYQDFVQENKRRML